MTWRLIISSLIVAIDLLSWITLDINCSLYSVGQKSSPSLKLFVIFSLRLSIFPWNFSKFLPVCIYTNLPISVDLSWCWTKWRYFFVGVLVVFTISSFEFQQVRLPWIQRYNDEWPPIYAIENLYSRNVKLRLPNDYGSMKDTAMRFVYIMEFLAMTDRMVWPQSLWRDRKWPRITKCTHSRVVGLRLKTILVRPISL